ncbi:hypothetical protein ACOMHN_036797 [Nucella lapillus]
MGDFLAGMHSRHFMGLPTVHEVSCSAHTLDPSLKIYVISLFALPTNRIVAYVDLMDGRCATSAEFASCVLDVTDTRRTRLVVLAQDVGWGEWRQYGCNVTSNYQGQAYIVSWTLRLTGRTSYKYYMVSCKYYTVSYKYYTASYKYYMVSYKYYTVSYKYYMVSYKYYTLSYKYYIVSYKYYTVSYKYYTASYK